MFCPIDINAILACPSIMQGVLMQINLYFCANIKDIMRTRLRWRFLEMLATMLLGTMN